MPAGRRNTVGRRRDDPDIRQARSVARALDQLTRQGKRDKDGTGGDPVALMTQALNFVAFHIAEIACTGARAKPYSAASLNPMKPPDWRFQYRA